MASLQHTLQQADISYDAKLLIELSSLIEELNISPDDFVNEWQSYSMNNDSNKNVDVSSINPDSFPLFSKQLRVSKTVKMGKKSRARSQKTPIAAAAAGFMHNAQTIGALMDNISTPIAAHSNKHRPKRRQAASTTKVHHVQSRMMQSSNTSQRGDDQDEVAAWLNMSTPCKSVPSSSHSIESPIPYATTNDACTSQQQQQQQTPSTQNHHNRNHNRNHNHTQQQSQQQSIPSHMMQSPAPMSGYKSRKNKGATVCALNADRIAIGHRCARVQVRRIAYPNDTAGATAAPSRFMYEDVHHKQDAIKRRLRHIGLRLMREIIAMDKQEETTLTTSTMDVEDEKDEDEHAASDNNNGKKGSTPTITNEASNDVESFYSSVQEPSQCARYYLGRIMNDGDNAGSDKITAGNMVLEGDPFVSFGSRVRLDVTGVNEVALFPGQMVAVKGLNSSGKEIFAEKIYTEAYCRDRIHAGNGNTNAAVTAAEDDDDGTLRVMMACGPFTAKNSVDFEASPLYDFGKQVTRHEPNVVILTGPFTDSDNELLKKNQVSVTFEDVFEHLLRSLVQMIASHCDEIVVIPSTKDLHHFSAFPQEAYTTTTHARFGQNVRFLSNPTQFRINNVSFGISSADFLFDCCRMGFMRNLSDRLLSMMAHCINQQSFYPLQPSTPSLRMDHDKYERSFMSHKLDLFLMPSTLKQFAKIYAHTDTVCVNPSFLTKLNSGGTYAMLYVQQSNDYSIQDYSKLIRVDVLKI